MVEGEFVDIVDAVGVFPQKVIFLSLLSCIISHQLLNRLLHALSQIQVVRKVECSIVLECLKHCDELSVLGCYV